MTDNFLNLARLGVCILKGGASPLARIEVAKQLWRGGPIEATLRSAAEAGGTTGADWAAKLDPYTQMIAAFESTLARVSLPDAMWGAGVRVPLNTTVVMTTASVTGSVVGQGKVKPLRELSIGAASLVPTKLSIITALVRDVLSRGGEAAAELVFRQMRLGLGAASTAAMLADVLDGATAVPASGADADAFLDDFGNVVAAMPLGVGSALFVAMPAGMVARLALARTSGGAIACPDLNIDGGTIKGAVVVPVAEEALTDSGGVNVVVIDAAQVALARGVIVLDRAESATLELESEPDEPTTTGTVLTSLWQNNLVALRVERYMSWQVLRSSAVGVISGAEYLETSS